MACHMPGVRNGVLTSIIVLEVIQPGLYVIEQTPTMVPLTQKSKSLRLIRPLMPVLAQEYTTRPSVRTARTK